MAVFDSVKNGVACLCDPLKQFFGVKFEERNLAKLSPIGSIRGIVGGISCHSASCNNRLSSTATKPSLEARREGEMHVLPKAWSGQKSRFDATKENYLHPRRAYGENCSRRR